MPLNARVACTRWAFDSGTSQSGREGGTSAYSWTERGSQQFVCLSERDGGWRSVYPAVFWRELGGHTPLTRSNMSRMATQNSSKSKLPSLSTSARSHTRSSWSSRSCEFLRTEAACAPERWVPPLAKGEKISQYFSTSACSIRLLDMVGGAEGKRVDFLVPDDQSKP